MTRRATILRNALFSAVTAAALGFGMAQTLAAPLSATAAGPCTGPYPGICNARCVETGFAGGYCTASGTCQCYR